MSRCQPLADEQIVQNCPVDRETGGIANFSVISTPVRLILSSHTGHPGSPIGCSRRRITNGTAMALLFLFQRAKGRLVDGQRS
jgi:hypothetical protein